MTVDMETFRVTVMQYHSTSIPADFHCHLMGKNLINVCYCGGPFHEPDY